MVYYILYPKNSSDHEARNSHYIHECTQHYLKLCSNYNVSN